MKEVCCGKNVRSAGEPARASIRNFKLLNPNNVNYYGASHDLAFTVTLKNHIYHTEHCLTYTIAKTLKNWTLFLKKRIFPKYDSWITNKAVINANLKNVSLNQRITENLTRDDIPVILVNKGVWDDIDLLYSPRKVIEIRDIEFQPRLWTETNFCAFKCSSLNFRESSTDILIESPSWETYFINKCKIQAAYFAKEEQLILNNPEEALYIYQLTWEWPAYLRREMIRIWEPILSLMPFHSTFFTFACKNLWSTLKGYMGKLDVARIKWNEIFEDRYLRSVAHLVACCQSNIGWENDWCTLGAKIISDGMLYENWTANVCKAMKKALVYLFTIVEWNVPTAWSNITIAVEKFLPSVPNPCQALPLHLWFQFLATSKNFMISNDTGVNEIELRVELFVTQLNLLFLGAFRPSEAINLREREHIKLFKERLDNGKIIDGAYIFLTQAKNLKQGKPPQLICMLETHDLRFSLPTHVDIIRKLKRKLKLDHIPFLFCDPFRKCKWNYDNLRVFWKALIKNARDNIPSFPQTAKLTLYTGRKTFIAAGVDLMIPRHVTQAVTRHESLETLERWYEKTYRYRRGKLWSKYVNQMHN